MRSHRCADCVHGAPPLCLRKMCTNLHVSAWCVRICAFLLHCLYDSGAFLHRMRLSELMSWRSTLAARVPLWQGWNRTRSVMPSRKCESVGEVVSRGCLAFPRLHSSLVERDWRHANLKTKSQCSHPSQLGCAATLLQLAHQPSNCKHSERSHRAAFQWQATYIAPRPVCPVVSRLLALCRVCTN